MILARRRRRDRMRVRMRSAVVGDGRPGERGGRRRHRRRYRRFRTCGHHGDVGRRHWARQRSGTCQSAGAGDQMTAAHYVTCRAHRRGIIRPARWIANRRRRWTRIAIVAHITASAVVHLYAVEAHVVRRCRARVADVTRLRHCNVRTAI